MGFKQSRSPIKIAPRTEPVGPGGTSRVPHVIQSLGAPKIVEIFAFLVEGCPWMGCIDEHERPVAALLPGPGTQFSGHVIIGATHVRDAKAVLLDAPKRIVAGGSLSHDFRDLLRVQAVRSFYGC
jgi:hypothetical protein